MRKLIIVPSLIKDVLSRYKMPVSDILNFNKLCEVLSPEDIRALLIFQYHGAYKDYLIEENNNTALLSIWQQNLSVEKTSFLDSLVKLNEEQNFDKDSLNKYITDAKESSIEFSIIPVSSETIFLIINKNLTYSEDYIEQDINIVENILRVLYGEYVQEDIARTSIFRRYIKMLSKTFA